MNKKLAEFESYYSYGQFCICDVIVNDYPSERTNAHFNQGFLRKDSAIWFRAIGDAGKMYVTIYDGEMPVDVPAERAIEVSILLSSGQIAIWNPEDGGVKDTIIPLHFERKWYRLGVAQELIDDNSEAVALYFKESPDFTQSKVVIRDKQLTYDKIVD